MMKVARGSYINVLSLRAFSARYKLELYCSPAMVECLIVFRAKAVPTSISHPTSLSCTVPWVVTKIGYRLKFFNTITTISQERRAHTSDLQLQAC